MWPRPTMPSSPTGWRFSEMGSPGPAGATSPAGRAQTASWASSRSGSREAGGSPATGTPPVEAYLPVLRVGAMVSYSASLEDRFQEREEVWIDARTCLPLEAPMRAHVASQSLEAGIDPARPMLDSGLLAALATAHTLIEGRALAR